MTILECLELVDLGNEVCLDIDNLLEGRGTRHYNDSESLMVDAKKVIETYKEMMLNMMKNINISDCVRK